MRKSKKAARDMGTALIARLKDIGVALPDGAAVEPYPATPAERAAGAWSWEILGADHTRLDIGSDWPLRIVLDAPFLTVRTDPFGQASITPSRTAPPQENPPVTHPVPHPSDIPTRVLQAVYSTPADHATHRMSMNAVAEVLAPYWTDIEHHFRTVLAQEAWALRSPAPAGSEHYRSGWADALDTAFERLAAGTPMAPADAAAPPLACAAPESHLADADITRIAIRLKDFAIRAQRTVGQREEASWEAVRATYGGEASAPWVWTQLVHTMGPGTALAIADWLNCWVATDPSERAVCPMCCTDHPRWIAFQLSGTAPAPAVPVN